MVTIWNLGSNESVEVNIKTAFAPNCFQSSGLKATGIFVLLMSQDSFESDSPETNIQTIAFVQYWASADLLLLIKSTIRDGFY